VAHGPLDEDARWESGGEEDERHALEMLKDGCEVREGCYDDRPEFPV
jgi:hypothetical protein